MRTTGKIVLWSIVIFFAIIIFAVISFLSPFSSNDDEEYFSGSGEGVVAIIELNDKISESTTIVNQFKKFRKNNFVRSILLRINSPGGGVAPSQEIYEEVKKTRDSGIPVVVSMGSVCASGGYYISLGANKIMANPGTLTGSIGVISEFVHFNKMFEKVGISTTTIKSGKFKDVGSPFRQTTKEENLRLQKMLDDVYNQFVEVVIKERKMDKNKAIELADGSVYSGRQAYELGLIDTIGTYEDAIMLSSKLGGIQGEPSIIRQRKKEKLADIIFSKIFSNLSKAEYKNLNETILQYSLQF